MTTCEHCGSNFVGILEVLSVTGDIELGKRSWCISCPDCGAYSEEVFSTPSEAMLIWHLYGLDLTKDEDSEKPPEKHPVLDIDALCGDEAENPLEKYPSKLQEILQQLESFSSVVRDVLIEEYHEYGNSALNPCTVFSDLEPSARLRAKLDEKVARLVRGNCNEDALHDTIYDLVGCWVQLRVAERDKLAEEFCSWIGVD